MNIHPTLDKYKLIETILWEDGGYFLLDMHLDRLEGSAQYFSVPCERDEVWRKLTGITASFDPGRKYKVRFLFGPSGISELSSSVVDNEEALPRKICISEKRTDKNDIFLRHKTTNRFLYNEQWEQFRGAGFLDVIFLNQDGEVTEGAISNIITERKGVYFTPPLECGVLPGIYRKYLLEAQEIPLREKVLHKEDLFAADSIFVINSVMKMVPVIFGENNG